MEEGSICWDHGLASLRCIRAAFDTFDPRSPDTDRQVQIVRGVWGFIPYATEFWAMELQEMTAVMAEKRDPRLARSCSELSALLATYRPGPDAEPSGQIIKELDPIRLPLPSLWYDATLSLQARFSGRHRMAGPDSGKSRVLCSAIKKGCWRSSISIITHQSRKIPRHRLTQTLRFFVKSHPRAPHLYKLRGHNQTCHRNTRPFFCHTIRIRALLRQLR